MIKWSIQDKNDDVLVKLFCFCSTHTAIYLDLLAVKQFTILKYDEYINYNESYIHCNKPNTKEKVKQNVLRKVINMKKQCVHIHFHYIYKLIWITANSWLIKY